MICDGEQLCDQRIEMAEDLSDIWKKLSLNEAETLEWETPDEEVNEVVTRGKVCVLGKLMADRLVSKETIKMQLL